MSNISSCSPQVAVAALNFLFGFGTVTASYVMQVVPKTQAAQRVLVHLFRLFPPFLMGEGLIQLTAFHFFNSLAAVQGEGGALSQPHRKYHCCTHVRLHCIICP